LVRGALPNGVDAARGDERDGVTDVDAQHVGKPRADGDAALVAEAVERPEADVVGDERQCLQAVLRHAAHERERVGHPGA
jgi:hypothetical protein